MHKIRNLKVCYNSPTKSSSVLKEESSLTTTLVSLILTGLFNTSLLCLFGHVIFFLECILFIQVFKLIGILFIILLLKEFHSTSCFCNFLPPLTFFYYSLSEICLPYESFQRHCLLFSMAFISALPLFLSYFFEFSNINCGISTKMEK